MLCIIHAPQAQSIDNPPVFCSAKSTLPFNTPLTLRCCGRSRASRAYHPQGGQDCVLPLPPLCKGGTEGGLSRGVSHRICPCGARYSFAAICLAARYTPAARKSLQGGLSRAQTQKKDGAFCAVPFGCPGVYSIVMLCVSGSFGCSAFGNSRVRTPSSYLHLIDSGRMSPT